MGRKSIRLFREVFPGFPVSFEFTSIGTQAVFFITTAIMSSAKEVAQRIALVGAERRIRFPKIWDDSAIVRACGTTLVTYGMPLNDASYPLTCMVSTVLADAS